MHIASGAQYAQSVLPQGGELSTPRNERHIAATQGKPGAEVTANATGTHHRNSHHCSF
jgi:hypothetical protein